MNVIFSFCILLLGGLFIDPISVFAEEAKILPLPLVYPENTWAGHTQALVRVLDRETSHSEIIHAPVGETVPYKTLFIRVNACIQRPPSLPFDAAAHFHLEEKLAEDKDKKDAITAVKPFDGWAFSNEPELAIYESPLYNVQIVKCEGKEADPIPKALTETLVEEYNNSDMDIHQKELSPITQ